MEKYKIEPMNLLDDNNNEKHNHVIVALYQPEITELNYRSDGKMFILKENEEIFEKIIDEISLAIEKGVNIFCIPELFMNEKFFMKISHFINSKNHDIIIIGGSYYRRNVNISPVITLKGDFFTEKIIPSAFERSDTDSQCQIFGGNTIYYFKTKFGNFIVLICRDFLSEDIRRDIFRKYKNELDFIFIISANRDSLTFHQIISLKLRRYPSLYICYCNCVGKLSPSIEPDGKTSIFGFLNKEEYNYYESIGLKPNDNINYKVCDLDDNEDILIADFNLKKKKPDIPKHFQLPDVSNISIRNPRQYPIVISYDDSKSLEIPIRKLIRELKNLKKKDYIYKTMWRYISRENPHMIIPLNSLMDIVEEKVKYHIEKFFTDLRAMHPELQVTKVLGWQEIYQQSSYMVHDMERDQARLIVEACKGLAEKYCDVSPNLNVISQANYSDNKIKYMIITGNGTDKRYISPEDLFVVQKGEKLYDFYGFQGYPSSETAINWAIHEQTKYRCVIHLNSLDIRKFVSEILTDPFFLKILRNHNKIKIKRKKYDTLYLSYDKGIKAIPIVDRAVNIHVSELAEMVAGAFRSAMEEGIPEEDICVCGVKHAIWFVRNSLDNIVEESEEINLIIANFLKEYHKLRIEQTLLG